METRTRFQNWIRKEEIGRGGVACVFLVEDQKNGQTAVLKEVRGSETLAGARRAQLRCEAQVLQQLRHPRIPAFYTFYETPEAAQLFMAYVPGENAEVALQRRGTFPTRKVIEIGLQTSAILTDLHCHRPPILHGDVKPSNLLLHPDGSVYLLDFGTSGSGACPWGTADYAAPEQCAGGYLDARSDLYALGRTLQHLRYGVDFSRKKLRNTVGKCSVEDAALAQILYRLTRSDPTARYGSAEEVHHALADLLHLPRVKRRRLRRIYHTVSCAAAFGFCLLQGRPLFESRAAAAAFVEKMEDEKRPHSGESNDNLLDAQRLRPEDPRPIAAFLQHACEQPVDEKRAAQLDALWAAAALSPSDCARFSFASGALLFFQYTGEEGALDSMRERVNRSIPYFTRVASVLAPTVDLSGSSKENTETMMPLLAAFLGITSFYRTQVMQVGGLASSASEEEYEALFSALSLLRCEGARWLHNKRARLQYAELWIRLLDTGCFDFARVGVRKERVVQSLNEARLLVEEEETMITGAIAICRKNLDLAYAAGGEDEK
uniref:serine/threonine-protein kinase n=1 Tax=Ndongobacter massiliensis TaxID=1871025 RepID=UPI0009307197|nr:serine/threonine-protein kinase [Ndongobacter massiliensis]